MGGVLFYTCKAVIVVKEKIAPNRTCSLGQNQKERKRTYFAAKMTPIPNRVYIKRGRMASAFLCSKCYDRNVQQVCLPMVLRIFTFCFAAAGIMGAASLLSPAFEFWSGSSMTGVVNGSLLDLASGETVGKKRLSSASSLSKVRSKSGAGSSAFSAGFSECEAVCEAWRAQDAVNRWRK